MALLARCCCKPRERYFFVLDRTSGKSLLTTPFAAVNWSAGVDQMGVRFPNPAKEPARDGRLIAPDEGGATNYRSPSFDAQTGLFIVSAQDSYGIYFSKPEHGEYGWGRRRLRTLRQRDASSDRLSNGENPLDPRLGRWSFGRRCFDYGLGIDIHRGLCWQRSCPPDARWHNVVSIRASDA